MNAMFAAMLGIWEIIIILMVMLVMGGLAVAAVFLVIWLTRRKPQDPRPAASGPPPPPPPMPSTPVPGWCSRCETPLPPGSPQGLCPRCVMSVGLATETEAGPHGTKIVPPPEAEVARRFPHLEILGSLGHGGMGVVYKARQPKLNRTVALKILTPEKGADPRFAERFQREAQALARLSHPNIIAVHDYGEADGMFFLVMEYVDGMNLRQLLREGQLKAKEALAIVPPICEALQFAHEQGVVHRDIKPENVLIDKQGRVKIADFGIAKLLAEAGTEGQASLTQDQVIGTPHYMAPEQVEHPESVDHRADIYSLGVVFYELLTGELPLGKFQPPSRKVQVDVRLDEVVLRALEKEPDRRYQKAREVKTDVETISASNPVMPPADAPAAEPPGTGARAFLKTRKGKLSLAGTILVVLIGLGIWLAAPRHPDYVLTGQVVDATTQAGLSNAVISIRTTLSGDTQAVQQVRADLNGNYRLEWSHDADLLYWRDNVRYSMALIVAVKAPGFEEQTVSLSDTHHAGYYRRALNFRLNPVVPSAQGTVNSVRVVVGPGGLKFEGQPTTWDQLGELLAQVPDRQHTILELAVTSDQVSIGQQNEWTQKAGLLAREHGFKYASFVGVHRIEDGINPGSGGSAPENAGLSRETK